MQLLPMGGIQADGVAAQDTMQTESLTRQREAPLHY